MVPPVRETPHRLAALAISRKNRIFCIVNSSLSDRENVAIKVNKIALRPHRISVNPTMNSATAMYSPKSPP